MKRLRKRVVAYSTSMTLFRVLYYEGVFTKEDMMLIHAIVAEKHRLASFSIFSEMSCVSPFQKCHAILQRRKGHGKGHSQNSVPAETAADY